MRNTSQRKIARLCCGAGLLVLCTTLEVFGECKDGEVKHTLTEERCSGPVCRNGGCSVSVCRNGAWGEALEANYCKSGNDSWCCEPTHVCAGQPRTCEMSREYCNSYCAKQRDPQGCKKQLNCAAARPQDRKNNFLGSNPQPTPLATATVDQVSD